MIYSVQISQTRSWELRVEADDIGEAKYLALTRLRGDGWDDDPDYISDFEIMNVEEGERE